MKIEYGTSKEIKCYRDFVQNPDDRSACRAFSKMFGKNWMAPAKKLHDRLKNYPTAADYNKDYGRTDNRIELKVGVADKKPLILKVRISGGPRKFFNHLLDNGECLLKKDWQGDFSTINTILVIEVNNHNYDF